MFQDVMGTVDLRLPSGWAIDLASSSATTLVFRCWTGASPASLNVKVRPSMTSVGMTDEDWVDAVVHDFPSAVTRSEPRPGPHGPVVWAERPKQALDVHQRWAVVRGRRLDVIVEHVGVELGSSLATPELLLIVGSLSVPAESQIERLGPVQFKEAMERATELLQQQNTQAAVPAFARAREIAIALWHQSLVWSDELDYGPLIGSLRCSRMLVTLANSVPELDRLMHVSARLSLSGLSTDDLTYVQEMSDAGLELHRSFGELPARPNVVDAGLLRAKSAVVRAVEMARGGASAAALRVWAGFAMDVSAQTVLITDRLAAAPGAVAPAADGGDPYIDQLRGRALELLLAAAVGGQVAWRAIGSVEGPDRISDWVSAARRLVQRGSTPGASAVLASGLLELATNYDWLGDSESLALAAAAATEGRDIAARLEPDVDQIRAQLDVVSAWVELHSGRAAAALAFVELAAEHSTHSAADPAEPIAVMHVRANALLALGRVDEAVAAAHGLFVTGQAHPAESAHRLTYALTLRASADMDGALAQTTRGLALALAEPDPFSPTTVRLLFVVAELADGQGNSAIALRATDLADRVLEIQRVAFGSERDLTAFDDADNHRQLAGQLVVRLLHAQDVLGALAAADRNRARTLSPSWLSRPDRSIIPSPIPVSPDAALDDSLTALESAVEALLASIGTPIVSGAELVHAVAVHGRTTLLLHPTPTGLVRFLIRPDQPIWTHVSDQSSDEIATLCEALRNELGFTVATRAARGAVPRPVDPEALARMKSLLAAEAVADAVSPAGEESGPGPEISALAAALLGNGLLDELGPDEPVCVIPFRDLSVVPLSVLANAIEPGRGRAWSMSPSMVGAATGPLAVGGLHSAVVIGDPTLDPGLGLPELAGARAEAADVGSALQSRCATTVLIGDDATEPAVRDHLRGARIVHFACHAALRDPAETSALFLGVGAHDDGTLLASEISDLALDQALVVLAACESGLGRATADGVQGLGQSFLRAGARTVLMSLWRVSDSATALLMNEFYRHLLADGIDCMDAAAALAAAQSAVRAAGFDDVGQWGPWVLLGDGGWRL